MLREIFVKIKTMLAAHLRSFGHGCQPATIVQVHGHRAASVLGRRPLRFELTFPTQPRWVVAGPSVTRSSRIAPRRDLRKRRN